MTKAPWCPVTATVEVIGGRWKPTILFQLKDQPRRFNELRRLVPGITQRHGGVGRNQRTAAPAALAVIVRTLLIQSRGGPDRRHR